MMDARTAAALRPTTTLYPAAWVGDFATAGEAFLAAGCPVPLAAVADYELSRVPEKVACVDLAGSIADGGRWPEQPAWWLLNPGATVACVSPNDDGSFALFAGYAAKALPGEVVMEGLIREFQQATGLRWLAIVQTRMRWVAARVAQSAQESLRGPTE